MKNLITIVLLLNTTMSFAAYQPNEGWSNRQLTDEIKSQTNRISQIESSTSSVIQNQIRDAEIRIKKEMIQALTEAKKEMLLDLLKDPEMRQILKSKLND